MKPFFTWAFYFSASSMSPVSPVSPGPVRPGRSPWLSGPFPGRAWLPWLPGCVARSKRNWAEFKIPKCHGNVMEMSWKYWFIGIYRIL